MSESDKTSLITIINSVEAECREGTFGENDVVKRILDQIQQLGRMDLTSSKRVYPITIGKVDDSDYITVDDMKINVSLRTIKKGDSVRKHVWLNSGMLAGIQTIYGRSFETSPRYRVFIDVDDGSCFSRELWAGEVIWVDDEMFHESFYPFVKDDRQGGLWRIPLTTLQEAIDWHQKKGNKDGDCV